MHILQGDLKYLVIICFKLYTVIIYTTQTLYPQQLSKQELTMNQLT